MSPLPETVRTPVTPPVGGVLPVRAKLAWGTGALGVSVLMNGLSLLILFYLVSVVQMDPALAGTLIFVSKVYDAVSDPVTGLLSDRTRSRYGRRRPYLFAGAIISSSCFALLFSVPAFSSETIIAGYVLLCLLLYTTGYSLFNVPYMAMPAEMTHDYHERSSIQGYRVVFISIGSMLAASGAPLLLEALGRGRTAYAALGVTFGAVIFVAMITTVLGTRAFDEQPQPGQPAVRPADMLTVFRNHSFNILILTKLFQLTAGFAFQASLFLYLTYALSLPLSAAAVIGPVAMVSTIIVMPAMIRLSRHIGKRPVYMIGAVALILHVLSWLLAEPGEPVWKIGLRAALLGLASAGNIMMASSMLTDVIRYDAVVTGKRREASYMAVYSFVEKLASAIGPLIAGMVLSFAGLDKNGLEQAAGTPAVRSVLDITVVVVPVLCYLLSIATLSFYRLSPAMLETAAQPREPTHNDRKETGGGARG